MTEPSYGNRLVHAYHRMLERMQLRLEALEHVEKAAFPQVYASIEQAAEKAVELGELTRDEARLLGGYLRHDLEDAGQYFASTGRDLGAWLRFDVELLEDRLLDWFQRCVDQSRLEGMAFTSLKAGAKADEHRGGEATGPGSL
jgi:Zinc-ribbon containing domain